MLRQRNSPEDSDETEAMPRNILDTDTEELHRELPSEVQKVSGQSKTQYDQGRIDHCYVCGQMRCEIEPEVERRRRRRTKSQLQYCPSCHYPAQAVKYCSGKMKHSDNVEAVLNRYEHFLTEPIDQPIKKSQSSPLSPRPYTCSRSPRAYYHSKQRQSGSRRRERKNEQDPAFSSVFRNFTNSNAVNESIEGCCGYLHPSTKNSKKESCWRDHDVVDGRLENSDADSESPEKYTREYQRYKKCSTLKTEVRGTRKSLEKTKSNLKDKKYLIERKEDAVRWQQLEPDDPNWSKLKLERTNLKKTDLQSEIVTDDQEEQTRRKIGVLPNKLLGTQFAELKTGSQNSTSRNRNIDDSVRNKTSSMLDASDFSKDEDSRKQLDGAYCKFRGRSFAFKDSTYKTNEDPGINKEESKTDSHCEIIVKNRKQETISKNVYAAGDMDLCATKSHILSLIDRALSNEFGTSSDQKNVETKHGSTQDEICIEITRALQGDCCQTLAQDLLNHEGSSDDYIKQLKMLRWEHLNHIQEEFRKLCSLQKYLDNWSPRQSLPMLQSQATGEPCGEERAQQEEKQELTTAS